MSTYPEQMVELKEEKGIGVDSHECKASSGGFTMRVIFCASHCQVAKLKILVRFAAFAPSEGCQNEVSGRRSLARAYFQKLPRKIFNKYPKMNKV
jgi:hypothetical protein